MSSSFNNFHGGLRSLFHVLSDDHIGSMPRFAPGSLATRRKSGSESMDVEVVNIEETSNDETPGTPKTGSTKRKMSSAPEDGASSASKLRPRR
jgi:hypothetical protein